MNFQSNWVDLLILLILAYFAVQSWKAGLWSVLADFASFSLSLLISLRGYQLASNFLRDNFSLSHSVANALGFLGMAIISEAILGLLFAKLIQHLPKHFLKQSWNRALAVFPGLGEGVVIIAFLLTLVLGLPVNPNIKADISKSKIGGRIIEKTSGVENKLNEIFGGVIEDSLTYFTVKPQSRESVNLSSPAIDLNVDSKSETDMLVLVNQERKNAGVKELVWEPTLVPVARTHGTDMWKRQYFGHVSPEGEDVGDRLQKSGISYSLAGENLALAPTLNTAHTGLMNSEGHRENILEPRFRKIGIGVVDNGYYGKMFVQVFTD